MFCFLLDLLFKYSILYKLACYVLCRLIDFLEYAGAKRAWVLLISIYCAKLCVINQSITNWVFFLYMYNIIIIIIKV